ncbi:hypothetical protein HDU67_009673 [Dinochytrium kinnereticum]|nr:hypothetical protein HDU67_009673 [Dinochytrium kinnereticum]
MTLELHEEQDLGICGKAWPGEAIARIDHPFNDVLKAADVMAEYFSWRFKRSPPSPTNSSRRFRFLELGSGTGITSLLLARTLLEYSAAGSFEIIATDLEIAVDLIRKNISTNSLSDHVSGRPLAWGVDIHSDMILDDGPLDMVFASDVVYYPEFFEPLIKTLDYLTTSPKQPDQPEIVICCKIREMAKELAFYGKLGKYFHIIPIDDWEKYWETFKDAGFLLLRLERRDKILECDSSADFECLLLSWMGNA